MARMSEQKNALARVLVVLGVVASYVCPVLSKIYPPTIATCPRRAKDYYYLKPNNATKDLKVELFYDPLNHYHRTMADLVGTMIWNALAVEVVPVDKDRIRAACEQSPDFAKCYVQTFEEHRDVDPMSNFFQPEVFVEDDWINVDSLPANMVPHCYHDVHNAFMKANHLDFEQMKTNQSYCPDAVFYRGFNEVYSQFGLFVTPAAVDQLRGYTNRNLTANPLSYAEKEMPIFFRDLYNSTWLSTFAMPNVTDVEIDQESNEGMGNDFFDYYFKMNERDPFYFVPPVCQRIGVDKCHILYKNMESQDSPGMVEGLLTTYNLNFVVRLVREEEALHILRSYDTMGPVLFHGVGPNDFGDTVMTQTQRIQFPACHEDFIPGPDGTFNGRRCDWPQRVTSKMASSMLWLDLPTVIPVLDVLSLQASDIDVIQESSHISQSVFSIFPSREAALCHYAQDLIDSHLKAFLQTCSSAAQKVDLLAESCVFDCLDGEEAVFVGADRQPICVCQAGWHQKAYSPNIVEIFNTTVNQIVTPGTSTQETVFHLAEMENYLGYPPCVPNVTSGGYDCVDIVAELQFSGNCYPCPPGYVCTSGTTRPEACIGDHITSFARATQQSDCVCQPGAYRFGGIRESGESRCELCPVGRYKQTAGNDDCKGKCPLRTTSFIGATLPYLCLCAVGNYMKSIYLPYECDPCPAGGICPGKSIARIDRIIVEFIDQNYAAVRTAQGLPHSMKGWHNYQDTVLPPSTFFGKYSPKFSKCPRHAACLEGGLCGEGSSGYLCSECPAGHGRGDVYPTPCGKCYKHSISSMIHWFALQVIGSLLIVTFVKFVQACYGNPSLYALPVVKMLWDHQDVVHAAAMSTTWSDIMDFQEWPQPQFQFMTSKTWMWIMQHIIWPVVTFIPWKREHWTIGGSTSLFYCILEQHPTWILGHPEWTLHARVEYTRLVLLLFSVPSAYLLCMVIWFPIFLFTVKSQKKKLQLVQSKMWEESTLRNIASESHLKLGNVPRDLGMYATRLRRKNEVYIWQAASDDYDATHKLKERHKKQSYHSSLENTLMKEVSKQRIAKAASGTLNKANNSQWRVLIRRYIADSWPIFLVAMYWLYPSINRFFAAALLCSTWPSSEGGYTEGEYEQRVGFAGSILCGTRQHRRFAVPAAFGLALYGLGPPLAIIISLRKLELFSEKKKRLWAFHLNGFDLSTTVGRYWDAARYLRKLLLWIINIWATTDHILFLTLGWCGTATYLQAQFHPYTIGKNNLLNRLELVSLFGSQSQVFLYLLSHVKMSPFFGILVLILLCFLHISFLRRALGVLWDDGSVLVEYYKRKVTSALDKVRHVVRGSGRHVIEGMPATGDPITAKELADYRDAHKGEDSSSSGSESDVQSDDDDNDMLSNGVQMTYWLYRWIRYRYDIAATILGCLAWALEKFVKLMKGIIRPMLVFEEATHVTVDINKAELHVIGQFRKKKHKHQPHEKKKKGSRMKDVNGFHPQINLDKNGYPEAGTSHDIAPPFMFDHSKRRSKSTLGQAFKNTLIKPHKAFVTEKEDVHNALVHHSLNLMRSHFQSFLESHELAAVPLNWFGKILEEACRTKVEKPQIREIGELIDELQKGEETIRSMGGEEYHVFMEQKLFSLADGHVSRAQRRKWFMLFSLGDLNNKINMAQGDNLAYFLDYFMKLCFTRAEAEKRDVACAQEERMVRIHYSPPKKFVEPVVSAIDYDKEEVPTTRTVDTVRSVDVLLGKFSNSEIAHWDLLHGVPSEERGSLDARLHYMRKNFHKKMGDWVKNVPKICSLWERFETRLETHFYDEITPFNCQGSCIEHGEVHGEHVHTETEEVEEAVEEILDKEGSKKKAVHSEDFWALAKHFPPPGVKVLTKMRDAKPVKVNLLHRARKLLLYDLDPNVSMDLLRQLEQRLKQDNKHWQKSNVHWICASGVAPLRWLHSGLGATRDLISYTTSSELQIVDHHQRSRITEPYLEEEVEVQLPMAVLLGDADMSFNDCLLHRFLQRQWIERHERLHLTFSQRSKDLKLNSPILDQEVPGGFDEQFMSQHIRALDAEERMSVVDTVNAWRKAFALFEQDFIFGKALEYQMYTRVLYTKLGLPYVFATYGDVTLEEIAAARYPMTTCHGEPNPECKPALGSILPRDDRQTVWDAMRGSNLDHAMQVVERKMEEKTYFAEKEVKKHAEDMDDFAITAIRDELDAWITWVQLWFARAVFLQKPQKTETYLKTAMADIVAKCDEYYYSGAIDYETKEEIEQHLQQYPNSSWVVDLFMEIEAEAKWRREQKKLGGGGKGIVQKDLSEWICSRLDAMKAEEPYIRRTSKHGVPYFPYDPNKEPEKPSMCTMVDEASQVDAKVLKGQTIMKDTECTAALERKFDESQWKHVQTEIDLVEKELGLQKKSLEATKKDLESANKVSERFRVIFRGLAFFDAGNGFPPEVAAAIEEFPPEPNDKRKAREIYVEYLQETMMFGDDRTDRTKLPPDKPKINLAAGLEPVEPDPESDERSREAQQKQDVSGWTPW